MKAGDLNKRITILNATRVTTSTGFKDDYVEGKSVWAHVKHISDAEKIRAQMVQRHSVIRVTVRRTKYLSELTSADRVRYDGQVYSVDGIKPTENDRWLELTLSIATTRRV